MAATAAAVKLDRHWCSSLAMEGGRGEGGRKRWRRDEEMEEGGRGDGGVMKRWRRDEGVEEGGRKE